MGSSKRRFVNLVGRLVAIHDCGRIRSSWLDNVRIIAQTLCVIFSNYPYKLYCSLWASKQNIFATNNERFNTKKAINPPLPCYQDLGNVK